MQSPHVITGTGKIRLVPKETPASDFWKKLTALPPYKGLTQVKLAEAVTKITGKKYGQTGVQKWRAGAIPPIKICQKLAERAGVSVTALIDVVDNTAAAQVNDDHLTQLMSLWGKLNDESKKMVVGFAKVQRTIQFTGDNGQRDEFHKRLIRATESQKNKERIT